MTKRGNGGLFSNEDSRSRRFDVAEERALALAALRLGQAIDANGMTKRELAAILGVSPARVSQILSADANVTLRTLARAVEALECDLLIDVKERDAFAQQEAVPKRRGQAVVVQFEARAAWHEAEPDDEELGEGWFDAACG